jgi:hypothetical protein
MKGKPLSLVLSLRRDEDAVNVHKEASGKAEHWILQKQIGQSQQSRSLSNPSFTSSSNNPMSGIAYSD